MTQAYAENLLNDFKDKLRLSLKIIFIFSFSYWLYIFGRLEPLSNYVNDWLAFL